jgi:hypothetical protein
MMSGLVADGIRNYRRNFVIVGWLFLSKLTLAAIISVPLLVMLNSTIENSRYARVLLTDWSLDVFSELIHARENVLVYFLVGLVFYAVIVVFFKQFINGGIYRSLLVERRLTASQFFGECGARFADHVRLTLVMLIIYVFLFLIGFVVGSMVPGEPFLQFGETSMYPLFLHLAVVYPFLILGTILSDLLRLQLASQPDRPFKRQFQTALEIFRARFVKLNGIYYLYFLPFVIVWLLIEFLAVQVTRGLGNMFGVMLELILLQICSFLRTGQSLLAPATFAGMFEADTPESEMAANKDN